MSGAGCQNPTLERGAPKLPGPSIFSIFKETINMGGGFGYIKLGVPLSFTSRKYLVFRKIIAARKRREEMRWRGFNSGGYEGCQRKPVRLAH
jgi:hypothetical protein